MDRGWSDLIAVMLVLFFGWFMNESRAYAREGYALDFDGINDYLEIPADPSLDVTAEITMEAWLYWEGPLGVASFQIILNKDPVVFEMSIGDNTGNSKFLWALGDVSSFAPTVGSGWKDGGAIVRDEWAHVAMVYSGTQAKTYINGLLRTTYGASGDIRSRPNQPVRIGMRDLTASPSFFNGLIDEVKIWNRGLPQDEIVEGMEMRLRGDEEGLVAYWNFDIGSGQYVVDLSPNKNHARLGSTSESDENDPRWVSSEVPAEIPLLTENWVLYE
ncbi:MAG: LamG domain-containing protein [Candidatus Omnitrophica bacterium]|nr:LamG domain-containing protein [Candidatus Omnitrophota bacterium]